MVIINKNPNGDTRTAPKNISFEQFKEANDMHINDVANVMNTLAFDIMSTAQIHDWTKKEYEELFYNNFKSTINKGTDFVNDEWYKKHIQNERHHLLSRCPDDVNLIDVLEMITDCVCAGMSRSGEVRKIEINDNILRKALDNTVDMIKDMIIVKD